MTNAIILISVFVIGSLLYYFLSVKPRLKSLKLAQTGIKEEREIKSEKKEKIQKDEIIVAVALALLLHSKERHDEEKTVLTLKTVAKLYSPWSSKLYGLTKSPR